MARGRGRRPDDDLAAALEEERREQLRREDERRRGRATRRAGAGRRRADDAGCPGLAATPRPGTPTTRWTSLPGWSRRPAAPSRGGPTQRRDHPDPATFFGRGKAAELADARTDPGYDLLVVDSELSPSQQRNLEKRIDGPVLDRPGPDHRDLRAARQHPRGAPPGRACPAGVPAAAPGRRLVATWSDRSAASARAAALVSARSSLTAAWCATGSPRSSGRSPRCAPTARALRAGPAGSGRRWSRWSATPTPASPA